MSPTISEARREEAKNYMQELFSNLVIKDIAPIEGELYAAVYTMLFGSDEIARHAGTVVEVSIRENASEIYPSFTGRPDIIRRQSDQMSRFAEDPQRVGHQILDGLDHPAPGTPTPNHEKRMATIRSIISGRQHPVPGTVDSARWLTSYVAEARAGTLSEADIADFEEMYGDIADEYQDTKNSGLEDIFPDEEVRPPRASDVEDPQRRRMAMALEERKSATVH